MRVWAQKHVSKYLSFVKPSDPLCQGRTNTGVVLKISSTKRLLPLVSCSLSSEGRNAGRAAVSIMQVVKLVCDACCHESVAFRVEVIVISGNRTTWVYGGKKIGWKNKPFRIASKGRERESKRADSVLECCMARGFRNCSECRQNRLEFGMPNTR